MRITQISFILFFCFSLLSCEYFTKKNTEERIPNDYSDQEEIDYTTETKSSTYELEENEVFADFNGSKELKGATIYFFEDTDGNKINVRVNDLQDKEDLEPIVPSNLIKGSEYILIKDIEGVVREVMEK